MVDRRTERPASLEELVEATAMKAMQSQTGSSTLPIDAKRWGTSLDKATFSFWQENVVPNLPERTSRYPHRQLVTAVEQVLGRHSKYRDKLVVEMREFYGPDPDRPENIRSSLRGIVLHKKSKSHPGHYTTTEKDDEGTLSNQFLFKDRNKRF